MKQHLDVAPGVRLDIDAVTDTWAILGRKGRGKSFGGMKIAELMLSAGYPVAIIDFVGVWWGLRLKSDGGPGGFKIAVAGGERADIRLEESSGRLLAQVVANEHVPIILDCSGFSDTGARRFVADFCLGLYEEKGRTGDFSPVHVFVDEADEFAPQTINDQQKFAGASKHAINTIVRRARSRGIGSTLLTQRTAAIHKDVLTQVDGLIVFGLTSPQDQKAVREWTKLHDTHGRTDEMMKSLASLPKGDAWWWRPHETPDKDLFVRTRVHPRVTYDSSATPKAGEQRPANLGTIDVEEFQGRMAAMVEEKRANDPAALKLRIAELERVVVRQGVTSPDVERTIEKLHESLRQSVACRIAVDGEARAAQLRLIQAQRAVAEATEEVSAAIANIDKARAERPTPEEMVTNAPVVRAMNRATVAAVDGRGRRHAPVSREPEPTPAPPPSHVPERRERRVQADGGLGKAGRLVLQNLASAFPKGMPLEVLAVYCGYSVCPTFRNGVSECRTAGYVFDEDGNLVATTAGMKAAGDVEPLPTGFALIDMWQERLEKASREILTVLKESYPKTFTIEQLAEKCGYSVCPTFRNGLSKVRTLCLVTGRQSKSIGLRSDLFERG